MRIKGPRSVDGIISMPGDKSISHRVAMLASVARGTSRIRGFATSADCRSTLACIERLGISVERTTQALLIHGRGLRGYEPSSLPARLEAGNSGSTMRMLSGLLAGQSFVSVIDGDSSLRRRPMGRIMEPLGQMGARISAREGKLAPIEIAGGPLKPVHYSSPVASAQVKTCILFAGLYACGTTTVTEPARSRNHTELMLPEFGASVVSSAGLEVGVEGGRELEPVDYIVPGDISSAAFFVVAATLLPDSCLLIRDVNLNPTRTAFIHVLNGLGARIETQNTGRRFSEGFGDLKVSTSGLKGEAPATVLDGEIIANIVDEVPILAVAATQMKGCLEVRGARELRIKESDRIRTVVEGIRAMGGEIDEFEDGFAIEGPQRLRGGRVETGQDHRIAMAFTIAGLVAEGTTEIVDSDCAAVSFPEFYKLLEAVTPEGTLQHE